MDRLTRWNGKKWILPQGRTSDGESYWRVIAEKLAEYENTGMTPAEIEDMKRRTVMGKNEIKEVFKYLSAEYGKQFALEQLVGMLYREVSSGNLSYEESNDIYKELEERK